MTEIIGLFNKLSFYYKNRPSGCEQLKSQRKLKAASHCSVSRNDLVLLTHPQVITRVYDRPFSHQKPANLTGERKKQEIQQREARQHETLRSEHRDSVKTSPVLHHVAAGGDDDASGRGRHDGLDGRHQPGETQRSNSEEKSYTDRPKTTTDDHKTKPRF